MHHPRKGRIKSHVDARLDLDIRCLPVMLPSRMPLIALRWQYR